MNSISVRRCVHKFKRGQNKDQLCGAPVASSLDDKCARHKKKAEVKSRPKRVESKDAKEVAAPLQYSAEEDKICSICHDDILNNKYYLPCGHRYHKDCISTWIMTNDTCPMCRAKYEPLVEGRAARNEHNEYDAYEDYIEVPPMPRLRPPSPRPLYEFRQFPAEFAPHPRPQNPVQFINRLRHIFG